MRPVEERKALALAVIEAMPDSDLSVRALCAERSVKMGTFLLWVEEQGLSDRYARALELRAENDMDRIAEIAEQPAEMAPTAFGEHVDPGDVALRRLRIDTMKWIASKRLPKKYGEKLDIGLSGAVKTGDDFDLSKLTTEELVAWKALQSKAAPRAPANS